MTTPAVTAIKRAWPRATLSYIVEEPFRRLVEGNPLIDRVMAIPAKQGAAEFVRFIRELRLETYDAVVDFHGGPRASRIAWLARGKFKVGYKLKYKGWIYDARVPRSAGGAPIHSVENHLNLVRTLGIEPETAGTGDAAQKESPKDARASARPAQGSTSGGLSAPETAPPLFLPAASAEEKTRIDGLWAEHGLGQAKVVVLHIGAGNEFRDWGEENLAALTERLASRPGVKVVLAGAEADRARAERISARRWAAAAPTGTGATAHPSDDPLCNAPRQTSASPRPVVSLAGQVNLIELREVIARAALFVGSDSGPMHIAATTRTPIVAIFGPTLPDHFAPWRTEATIVAKGLACRPCKQRECVTADYRCLRTITVDEVLAAVRKYL